MTDYIAHIPFTETSQEGAEALVKAMMLRLELCTASIEGTRVTQVPPWRSTDVRS